MVTWLLHDLEDGRAGPGRPDMFRFATWRRMPGSGNMSIPGDAIRSLHDFGDEKLADEMFRVRDEVRNRGSRTIVEGFGWFGLS